LEIFNENILNWINILLSRFIHWVKKLRIIFCIF
jgi:hypothetical protein